MGHCGLVGLERWQHSGARLLLSGRVLSPQQGWTLTEGHVSSLALPKPLLQPPCCYPSTGLCFRCFHLVSFKTSVSLLRFLHDRLLLQSGQTYCSSAPSVGSFLFPLAETVLSARGCSWLSVCIQQLRVLCHTEATGRRSRQQPCARDINTLGRRPRLQQW